MTSSRLSGLLGSGRIFGLRRARGRASSSGSGVSRALRARTSEDHDVHVGDDGFTGALSDLGPTIRGDQGWAVPEEPNGR